ncbi:glycoside hydrolase family 3 C-terminal domain-containing protein [Oceanirhabdus seepicola]|uniref:Glycoside hydrolase family 3 C-terminal domain-containing protein n=1 Tax=Oceanirhabdus seepicola TaxID=2828781 RepID=A0A9J6NYD1_9CLOT|nr:glycoside hydrolase family 3 C-terminal domain-containing protein [Oceanirhabdus seepicola]MCM1989450.1 glycoside hydrolase family 3 C-terminal domain-containing protein [Oceanirhabdus seepicola]
MINKIQEILAQITLEEKASLCSGLDFWTTQPVERLGLPSIMVTDGPHGLRKQSGESDHLGLNASVPATCFPSGVGLASSWDRDLIEEVGVALGKEAHTENVAVLLGPAVNIKRSPLCGRNFEYFSEDPYLASQIAKHHILGVQSQGVGTSIKHFAANNQEFKRFSVDTLVDERTLREIYYASFETAIKEAKPWTVMCAYNKLNGTYCSEHYNLLTEVLRDDWGFEGLVVSDWGAVNDRVEGIKAGMDLEMPGNGGLNDKKIVEAVKNGELDEQDLDKVVTRVLRLVSRSIENADETATFDKEAHNDLARKVASECMVLLKNEEKILPLNKNQKVMVVGELAQKARYQGGGSSHINPTFLNNALEEIKKEADVAFALGYVLDEDAPNADLEVEAVKLALENDVVVVFAGLPDRYESEGYDREHMDMPANQIHLIETLNKANKNVVVVLSNGSPIEISWLDNIKAVLEGYLGGQAGGGAIADILYGKVNPSGKLAETFPVKLRHNPSAINFPGKEDKVEYHEGLFVGYRYYDAKDIEPLFPFGYGLSYTTFKYTDIKVDKEEFEDTEEVKVTVKVKNVGDTVGKEIIQLYVRDIEACVIRPEKELKEFTKVELQPGEEKEVEFIISKRAFAYYNVDIKDWYVETGEFEILVGGSSSELPLSITVKVNSTVEIKKIFTVNSTMGAIMEHPVGSAIAQQMIQGFIGEMDLSQDDSMGNMMENMMENITLRGLAALSGGAFTDEMIQGLLMQLND